MKSESKRKILVAGMGTSPAVLTNAVWALAGSWFLFAAAQKALMNRAFCKGGIDQ